jgi:hypothetical protein
MKRMMWMLLWPALAACSGNEESVLLPPSQRSKVERAARAGDLVAIKRLIAHHEAMPFEQAASERWRERARDLGDAQELYFQAARKYVAAEVEMDDETRYRLLLEAHHAAQRAQASRPERSTELLEQQIARAIEAQ